MAAKGCKPIQRCGQRVYQVIPGSLRGLSQIMLQANAWTGLCFLAAILWYMPLLGISALLGSALGFLIARWRRMDGVEQGLYGFNAALIALALAHTPRTTPWEIVWVVPAAVLGILLATLVSSWLIRRRVPIFTAPFVIIVWLILFPLVDFGYVPAFEANGHSATATPVHWLHMLCWSFGQVMFLGDSVSGLLVLLGLLIGNWRAALWAGAAALLASCYGYWSEWPTDQIAQGLFGYNAVLTAIALMGILWYWRIAGVLISCLIMHGFLWVDWPPLTAPFVLASWLMLAAFRLRALGNPAP